MTSAIESSFSLQTERKRFHELENNKQSEKTLSQPSRFPIGKIWNTCVPDNLETCHYTRSASRNVYTREHDASQGLLHAGAIPERLALMLVDCVKYVRSYTRVVDTVSPLVSCGSHIVSYWYSRKLFLGLSIISRSVDIWLFNKFSFVQITYETSRNSKTLKWKCQKCARSIFETCYWYSLNIVKHHLHR